jgi:hypothetical protein
MKKLELIKTQIFGSQKKMALELGISPAKMSYIFAGVQDMPEAAIKRLVIKYKICAHWLFSEDESLKIEYVHDFIEKDSYQQLETRLNVALSELLNYKTEENNRLKNNQVIPDTQ